VKRTKSLLIVTGMVLLFVLTVYSADRKKPAGQEHWQKAKPFALYDLQDNLVKYSDFEGKKVLLLSFFATWCDPCLKEIGELNGFKDKFDPLKIEILLVSTDKEKKKIIKDFVNKHQIKFRVICDVYGVMAKSYKVKGLPATFLIDKSGNIVFHQEGFTSKTIDEIESKVKDIMK
jgi:peroxiredoxin